MATNYRRILFSSTIAAVSLLLSYVYYNWLKRKKELPERQDVGESKSDDVLCATTGHKVAGKAELVVEEISKTDPNCLSNSEVMMLVSLLTPVTDDSLLEKVLITINNAAAFTRNQDSLREAGALPKLTSLLSAHRMALRVGQSITYPAVINGVISCINNMAMNQHNQKHLKDCIPALIDFASTDKTDESVQLASLQALTNLSVNSEYHTPYTKLVQQLFEYLDHGGHSVKLQALKVLANLSTNEQMVPHLLAAKAPACLLSLLSPDTETDLLIRWTTILANVIQTVKDRGLTATSLPHEYKAPSPETTYTALYGHVTLQKLKSKVFVLCRHSNTDIRHQASRIHRCLT